MGTVAGLRRGYTTGTCAAAAAYGAALMLFRGEKPGGVEIEVPAGVKLMLKLVEHGRRDEKAYCAVIKDAGDDPDVTHGAMVCAKVAIKDDKRSFRPDKDIVIRGGRGVGRVTKPGLAIPVGGAAINPVPGRMIREILSTVIPPEIHIQGQWIEVEISVPDGERLSSRTFNPRLGIIGGISILGTTGLVEPKSLDAWLVSLRLTLQVAKAAGYQELVLVPGNLGENFVKRDFALPPDKIIQIANWVGFALDECCRLKVKRVILAGHIGKLAKVAAGSFDTSSRAEINYRLTGDGPQGYEPKSSLKAMAAAATQAGAEPALVRHLQTMELAEAAASLLQKEGLSEALRLLAETVSRRAREKVKGAIEIGCILYDLSGKVLGMDHVAGQWALSKRIKK